jgi:mRNA interferase RelE/StbE
MLKFQISRKAQKFLSKLPSKQKNQVAVKIKDLRQNGHGADSVQLKGSDWHRTDIGEYRIIYDIEEDLLVIALVAKRNDDDVYKKLRRLE